MRKKFGNVFVKNYVKVKFRVILIGFKNVNIGESGCGRGEK